MSSGLANPVRTCLGCRGTDEQQNLIRMVADNDGKIKIDRSRTFQSYTRSSELEEVGVRVSASEKETFVWRPGRGAYVHSNRECIETLIRKGPLGRALRRKVVVDEDLQQRILRIFE